MSKTYQYSIVSFLIASLFLSVFVQTFVLVSYSFQVESYTEKYCVNKDKEDLHCEGKCHLSKELRTLDVSGISEQPTEETVSLVVSIFSFQQLDFIQPVLSLVKEQKVLYLQKNMYSQPHISAVFHPPTV